MLLLSVGPLRSERCCFLGCSKPLQTWKPENRLCFYIVEEMNSDTKQNAGYSMRSNLICVGGTRIQVPNGYTINMCTFTFLNCLTFIVFYYFYFSEAHHLPLELFPVYGLKCIDAVQPATPTIRSKDTLHNPTLNLGWRDRSAVRCVLLPEILSPQTHTAALNSSSGGGGLPSSSGLHGHSYRYLQINKNKGKGSKITPIHSTAAPHSPLFFAMPPPSTHFSRSVN